MIPKCCVYDCEGVPEYIVKTGKDELPVCSGCIREVREIVEQRAHAYLDFNKEWRDKILNIVRDAVRGKELHK